MYLSRCGLALLFKSAEATVRAAHSCAVRACMSCGSTLTLVQLRYPAISFIGSTIACRAPASSAETGPKWLRDQTVKDPRNRIEKVIVSLRNLSFISLVSAEVVLKASLAARASKREHCLAGAAQPLQVCQLENRSHRCP